jgi:hypothetical protein
MGFDIKEYVMREDSIRNAKTMDEVIYELTDDILDIKYNSIVSLKKELHVETDKFQQLKYKQQVGYGSSAVLIVLNLFLLAVLFRRFKIKAINVHPKNIDRKKINLLLLVWFLFHLFLLITSDRMLATRNNYEWRHFWVLADWESQPNYYDLSEFVVYAFIPGLIVLGRRYLKGEKLL